jgi:hypothetical protein
MYILIIILIIIVLFKLIHNLYKIYEHFETEKNFIYKIKDNNNEYKLTSLYLINKVDKLNIINKLNDLNILENTNNYTNIKDDIETNNDGLIINDILFGTSYNNDNYLIFNDNEIKYNIYRNLNYVNKNIMKLDDKQANIYENNNNLILTIPEHPYNINNEMQFNNVSIYNNKINNKYVKLIHLNDYIVKLELTDEPTNTEIYKEYI